MMGRDSANLAEYCAGGTAGQRLVFEAFVSSHEVCWLRFAHANIGSAGDAEGVIDEVVLQLGQNWSHALRQDNVERYAMNILKAEIMRWLTEHRRPEAFVDTAAFLRAVSHGSRRRFDILSESIGLYSAISALPERQFMVIVLRYVLGYADEQVAMLMGIEQSTVRSLACQAKQRLAGDLSLHGKD